MTSSADNKGPSKETKGITTPQIGPDSTLLRKTSGPKTAPTGQGVPTPFMAPDPALMMIDPGKRATLACVHASVALRLRPVLATVDTMFEVAATTRPLIVVADRDAPIDEAKLMDLAVSVGALVVRVHESDTNEELSDRIRVAAEAARRMRADTE